MFEKVLVANRGEIALRVIRACKELDIETVAVYSEKDQNSLHVKYADEACLLGPADPTQSYLNMYKIIKIAKDSGSEAIHPGYGFLSQIPAFARECERNDIKFIGPSSEVLEKMGNKLEARKTMAKANIPIIPGSMDVVRSKEEVEKLAEEKEIGYPILVKAVYGGGGKGMRVVNKPEEIERMMKRASSEAKSYFGRPDLYAEERLKNPRHIEFQILSDERDNVIHLYDRECSIQRRYQKLIEETLSRITNELREKMRKDAIKAAKACGYTNAGTVEFLLDKDNNYYFLEMNTRLQVEHLITELVTGIDIVKEQIRIAAGEKLSYKQEDIKPVGHAIDCRINAEDPCKDFSPSPGTVTRYSLPSGPGVRVDSGLYEDCDIGIEYDPLIVKVATWGNDRPEAIARMKNALNEFDIDGIETTIPFLLYVLDNEEYKKGEIDTGFVKTIIPDFKQRMDELEEVAAVAAALTLYIESESRTYRRRDRKSYNRWVVDGRLRSSQNGRIVASQKWLQI